MNVSVFRWEQREVPTELGSSKNLSQLNNLLMWSLQSFEHPPLSTRIFTFSPDDGKRSCFQNGVLCWKHMKTSEIHKRGLTPQTSVSVSQLLLWVLYSLWPFKKMTFWTELLPRKQLQLTRVKALLVIINIWDQVHVSTYTVLQFSVLILKYYVSLATNQQCSRICDTTMLLTHFTFPTVLLG